MIGELGWEAMEYLGQAVGFQGLMLSDNDTISDIVAAFIGTAFAAAVTWTRWRPSTRCRLGRDAPRRLGRAGSARRSLPGRNPPQDLLQTRTGGIRRLQHLLVAQRMV